MGQHLPGSTEDKKQPVNAKEHNFLHQVSHLLHTHIVSEGIRGLPWWTSGKESAF